MKCKLLGIDLGTKRIGLAISDPEGKIVSPLRVVDIGPSLEQCAHIILEAASEYEAGGLVIGLPLNMNGTESPQAKLSKSLYSLNLRSRCLALT